MKVALVHEHLAQDGGAERVLRYLAELYPDAPIFTLVWDRERANPFFLKRDVRTSFIQRLPGGLRFHRWYLSLMPTAVEQYDLSGFDVVLSSASGFAKGVITRPETLHVCYCHSPTRYLWSDTHQYVSDLPNPKLIKQILQLTLTRLRQWDRLAADRVDEFIANSQTVARRITKYYRRPSTIIHPPVEVSQFAVSSAPGTYYLTGGRLVAYKRFDLVIRAFNKLGLPLKVFGDGPVEGALKGMAKDTIEFVGRVSDKERGNLFSNCLAFINMQEEDFGITVLEAQAAGRPVIALAAGGALESIIPNRTGLFVADQDWESLADTVIRFKPEQFDPRAIRAHAQMFDIPIFQERIRTFIDDAWQRFSQERPSGV